MHLRSTLHFLVGLILTVVAGSAVKAAPPKLPPNSIAEDTFLVVTIDPARADPAALQATVKAALGDSAGPTDEVVEPYKAFYDRYGFSSAESVTITLRGNPDPRLEPHTIFYVKLKPGKQLDVVAKLAGDEAVQKDPAALGATINNDFLMLSKKGIRLPLVASADRTKLFVEALGDSDKPIVAALIFHDALTRAFNRHLEPTAPIGLATIVRESKWLRIELTAGETPAARVTIQAADEQAAVRVADGVTLIGTLFQQEADKMKANADPNAQVGGTREDLISVAEIFTPHQAGTTITLIADTKAVGVILRLFFTSTVAQSPATRKGA